METLEVQISIISGNEDLQVPEYATQGSAGVDLRAAVSEQIIIKPGERKLIPSGIKMAIPNGFEGQIRPRSGLALKYGISLVNSPGTIDSDYRGEIGVILINHGSEDFIINRGERIAQMVFTPVARAKFIMSDKLEDTFRQQGGFGHTGK